MAKRPCPTPRCPALIDKGQRRCPDCAREYEARRGSKQARGYGAEHQAIVAHWVRVIAEQDVTCWRCGEPIPKGSPRFAWDAGHDDHDRSITRGPEHANRCNRAAAGRASHW